MLTEYDDPCIGKALTNEAASLGYGREPVAAEGGDPDLRGPFAAVSAD
jgi:hypothetical protein